MKEHLIIKKKLELSIIPYLNCTSSLRKSKDFLLYHFYDYTKEIFTLLAGYGISHPIISSLYNSRPDTALQGQLSYLGIGLGVCTGVLRFAYGREAVAQKVIGQKKLIRSLSVMRSRVMQVLADSGAGSPLNSLIAIQKELIALVNNNVQENIYDFDGCFTEKNLVRSKSETDRLIQQFNVKVDETDEEKADETPDQIV